MKTTEFPVGPYYGSYLFTLGVGLGGWNRASEPLETLQRFTTYNNWASFPTQKQGGVSKHPPVGFIVTWLQFN